MENKIYSFLGLARKAGKVVSGDESCGKAIRAGESDLVIIAGDASDNTKKRFTDAGKFNGVAVKIFGKKYDIGKFVGKDIRAVVCIQDAGFAAKLSEMIDRYNEENGGEVNG
jgi:ribosomal protein L7Ae-like RNA K-turn-binding protein